MPGIRTLGRVLGGLVLWGSVLVAGPAQAQVQRPAAPHYDVVALRVAFQPDTTRFTTGDGTFAGALFEEGLVPSMDPLPHDAAYFQAHLAFLEAYVAQASDGRTQLTTHLVPEIVQVSRGMGAYSPAGLEADSDAERAKLVALIEEAWTLADRESTFDLSGFNPRRTAFVLFHAGVGRDIELLGTTLDKTPQDLPSIFFNERELARLGTGAISFKGMPVRHTLLLPRTETRPGFNFIEDQPFLLELSTNGLLAASFFNYLGVPDLFNTETGDPAIGPFGLMDPLGIFAYGGLFPPEPSAWTKYFLGWTTPQDLAGEGPETVTLSAAGLAGSSDVARAPISPAEYFFVENRHRDPEGDGLVLRVWQRGEIVEQRVQNGEEGFTRFDVSGFVGGVVVGADNYDWALPGGLDEDGNMLNGGILIWHVDERRIVPGLEGGGVNADSERRGLDLEEADSAQDLGFPPENPFGPAADQGTPFDFFFSDNPITTITATGQQIRFYENRFGPETIPDSHSNEGGPSFVTLEDFSAPGPEMTFVYRREAAAGVRVLDVGFPPADLRLTTLEGSYVTAWGSEDVQGVVLRVDRGGLLASDLASDGFLTEFAYVLTPVLDGDRRIAAIVQTDAEQGLRIVNTPDVPSPGPPEVFIPFALPPGAVVEGRNALLLKDDDANAFYAFLAGGASKALLRFDQGGVTEVPLPADPLSVAFDALAGRVIVVGRQEAAVLGGDARWSYTVGASEVVGQAVFGRDQSGLVGVVPILGSRTLLFLRADGTVRRIALADYARFIDSAGALSAFPVLADLDEDGFFDVLTTQGRSLVAFSQNGALLAPFPVALPATAVTQPLVAELSDSGAWSVLTALTDGYVYAYDLGREGRSLAGFPLAVGRALLATPLLQGNTLFAAADDGTLKGWELDGVGAVWWGQLYGNAQNHSYVERAAEPPPQPGGRSTELIVEAETYNWPNPIRDGQTFLRCMTTEDARVRITIIDAAGSLIDEVALDLSGGTPAEHPWQTDAASGLYYARVTATGVSGRTATKLIKMAIIR